MASIPWLEMQLPHLEVGSEAFFRLPGGGLVVYASLDSEGRHRFHRQGLAREFDCVGSLQRQFSWASGQAIPPGQLDPPQQTRRAG